MTYSKQTWTDGSDGGTPLSAARLGHIEDGIQAAAAVADAAQPADSDLAAIAALTTTAFGRAFLTLADAAAGRTALGLGTAATQATGAFDAAGAAAAAQSASQPLDSDLTAIAALSTTSFGRAFLALADAAAARTAIGLGDASTHPASDFATPASVASAVSTAINALTTGAPGLLDTLAEIDAAIGNDPNYATTVTTALGTKVNSSTYTSGQATQDTAIAGKADKSANLSDLASASTARTNLGLGSAATQAATAFATALVRAAVKTSAYTAAAGDLVPVDTTSGGVTITLPTAPADRTRVSVKHIIQGGTNAVTIAAGGSDVFNKAGGSTSVTLQLVNQSVQVQYDSGIWSVVAGDLPLSGLDFRFAPASAQRLISNPVRGRIVWIVDDALLTQRDLAMPRIEAVGGKLNFAIPISSLGSNGLTMVNADVTAIYQRGHQIMSHSLTHPDMTTQTAAQRTAEWDTSKSTLEGLTAVGAITDFVMPNNTSNLTTQTEAYLRYQRIFTGSQAPIVFKPGENGFHIGRNTWGTATHAAFLAAIRRIAVTGETYTIYCHDVQTPAVSAVNTTMMDEAIALAASLGVQWVRADEALVGMQPLYDAGFELGDLSLHSITTKSGTSTIDVVADTPSTGLPGTNSLRMVNDGVGQNIVSVGPTNVFIPRPTEEWTASCHIRQDKTSGNANTGGFILVRQWDEFGNNLGDVNSNPVNAAGAATTPWGQVSVAFVPNKLTRSITVRCMQSAMVGTTYFDHVHVAPTRMGVLG